jgi:hypothetical protein
VGAWLVALLADADRRRLVAAVLGGEQERALRQAAAELCPADGVRAGQLALVISEVFQGTPSPAAALSGADQVSRKAAMG